MAEHPAVELRNVTKRFGEVVAVDHVSLQIAEGDFFALLGPSGCGKTTTLRMIAGFEMPSEGELYIRGQYVGDTPPFRRNTNMVFQNYALFPHMSIARNIAFGLEMKRVPKAEIQRRVRDALEMVRLPGLGHRRPTQLSGGQQQCVALARALVNRPSVLLLDEPLGALDLKLRKEMQLELKRLQQQVGITFVYVTHDQGEALTMSNRIAVMNKGLVLQIGGPTEIYERPNCRFVADFIGESNFLDGQVLERDSQYVTVLVGGRLRVRVAAGPSSVLAERGLLAELPAGRPVTLAIRPEKIRLRREAQADLPNHFACRLEELAYAGTETLFRLRLEDGSLLSARQQNLLAATDPAAFYTGQEVIHVSWPAESTLLLLD